MCKLNQVTPLVKVVISHNIDLPDWLCVLAETIGLFVLLGLAPYFVAAGVVHLILGIFE